MTKAEVAALCGRSVDSVSRWIKSGKLKTSKRGLREVYIDPVDFDKFCTDNNIVRKGDG